MAVVEGWIEKVCCKRVDCEGGVRDCVQRGGGGVN